MDLIEAKQKAGTVKPVTDITPKQAGFKNRRGELERILDLVEKNCGQFLQAAKESGRFLYRGMTTTNVALLGRSHLRRRPLDSEPYFQDLWDTLLTQMGFQALRRNSIFCIADEYHAESYGTLYLIFPLDGFSYTYSKWEDVELDREVFQNAFQTKATRTFLDQLNTWLQQSSSQQLRDLAHYYRPFKNRGVNALTMCELMESFILNPRTYSRFPPELKPTVANMAALMDPAKFVADNRIKQTDLAQFLKTRPAKEICISGSYYALRDEAFADLARERFLL
jgi:hypothetical protein